MSRIKSIGFVARFGLAVAGLSGTAAAHAETPYEALVLRSANPVQSQRTAQVQTNTRANRSELSLMLAQDPAVKNPWAVTSPSGVNIQSRAGFTGYH